MTSPSRTRIRSWLPGRYTEAFRWRSVGYRTRAANLELHDPRGTVPRATATIAISEGLIVSILTQAVARAGEHRPRGTERGSRSNGRSPAMRSTF